MGCWTELTILAMGGGASSGSEGGDGARHRKGGGGSGFVNMTERVVVEYNNRLATWHHFGTT